jgi:hypothetical protein
VSGSVGGGGNHQKSWLHHLAVAKRVWQVGCDDETFRVQYAPSLFHTHCNKHVLESLPSSWQRHSNSARAWQMYWFVDPLCRIPVQRCPRLKAVSIRQVEDATSDGLQRVGPVIMSCRLCLPLHTVHYSLAHFYWQQRTRFSTFQGHTYENIKEYARGGTNTYKIYWVHKWMTHFYWLD